LKRQKGQKRRCIRRTNQNENKQRTGGNPPANRKRWKRSKKQQRREMKRELTICGAEYAHCSGMEFYRSHCKKLLAGQVEDTLTKQDFHERFPRQRKCGQKRAWQRDKKAGRGAK